MKQEGGNLEGEPLGDAGKYKIRKLLYYVVYSFITYKCINILILKSTTDIMIFCRSINWM